MKRFSFTVLFIGLFVTEMIGFSERAIATSPTEATQQLLLASSEDTPPTGGVGRTPTPPPGGST